jgi:hypothetical protein
MKFCCDKCEKVIEQGILGNLMGSQTIVIKSKLFSDENIILCNDCFSELRKFLNQKVGAK